MLEAGFWGLVGGLALVLGAVAGVVRDVPTRVIGAVMAFGAGVLISALAFELTAEAFDASGGREVVLGLLGGALTFYLGDRWLDSRGGVDRKRSGGQQAGSAAQGLVLGALLDGIPESVAIGVSLVDGGTVGVAIVAAVFLSNVPEGMSAATGLVKAGRSKRWVIGLWVAVALISGLASLVGYAVLGDASASVVAVIQAFAAGAILTMLADTMMPEAFEDRGRSVGLFTTLGFVLGLPAEPGVSEARAGAPGGRPCRAPSTVPAASTEPWGRRGPAGHFRTSVHASPLFAAALLRLARHVRADHGRRRRGRPRRAARALRELDPALRLVAVEVADRPDDLPDGIGWLARAAGDRRTPSSSRTSGWTTCRSTWSSWRRTACASWRCRWTAASGSGGPAVAGGRAVGGRLVAAGRGRVAGRGGSQPGRGVGVGRVVGTPRSRAGRRLRARPGRATGGRVADGVPQRASRSRPCRTGPAT